MTADMVTFARRKPHNGGTNGWMVLLIERKKAPHAGCLALPGGHFDVYEDEDLEYTARRELQEETGILVHNPELVGVWSKKDRDPRGRYISTAYFAVLPELVEPQAGDDAASAGWYEMETTVLGGASPIAFDHREMIREAWSKSLLWADTMAPAEGK
jgi:8-oxo-dGTP diphosphatase